MCYSARIKTDLKSLQRLFKAQLDFEAFETLFLRRLTDNAIRIPKALEANFYRPKSPVEKRIKDAIDQYRDQMTKEWGTSLFTQKKRLADAQRQLKSKETKKALDDLRIATKKINWYKSKIADLKRTRLNSNDSRIFPLTYAPLVVMENDEIIIRPMRYQCRLHGRKESHDKKYPGTYNARRDNLEGFWNSLFSRRHACMVITSFYENVALHDFEKRPLRPGEKEKNLILNFNPEPAANMILACLYDHWHEPGKPDLYSFAAITDEPPPEVAATGHNRCVISLKRENIPIWLSPEGRDKVELYKVLNDRERLYYAHELAA